MTRKQSTDPVFDQVSIILSDAANRNMNQRYVFFKNHLFPMGFRCYIVRYLYFLGYPLSRSLK